MEIAAPQTDPALPLRRLGPVVVTGGSSGLGRAVVDQVALAGGTPVVLDVREPEDGDGDAEFEAVDLADGRAAEEAVRSLAERHGGSQPSSPPPGSTPADGSRTWTETTGNASSVSTSSARPRWREPRSRT